MPKVFERKQKVRELYSPQDDHDQILKGIFKEKYKLTIPQNKKTCKYVSIARFTPGIKLP